MKRYTADRITCKKYTLSLPHVGNRGMGLASEYPDLKAAAFEVLLEIHPEGLIQTEAAAAATAARSLNARASYGRADTRSAAQPLPCIRVSVSDADV